MILVTGCNEPYLPRMQAYLASLQQYADYPVKLVTVGFDWASPFDKISTAELPRERNNGAPDTTESIQHGSFLQLFKDDDLYLYTDGDMTLQRPLSLAERDWLNKFGDNTASAGWNRTGESLEECINLIGPLVDTAEIYRRFPGDLSVWPSLNIGVLAMRRPAWEKIYKAYLCKWELAGETFRHQARQQWLVCYLIFALELDFQMMPWSFHAHGHFGLPPGVNFDGQVYYGGQLVAFRHHL